MWSQVWRFLRYRLEAVYGDNEATGGFLHFQHLHKDRCVFVCNFNGTRWNPLHSISLPSAFSFFLFRSAFCLSGKKGVGGIFWLLIANAPHADGLAYLMAEGWNSDCNQGGGGDGAKRGDGREQTIIHPNPTSAVWQRAPETERGEAEYEAGVIDSWFYIADLRPLRLCFSLHFHACAQSDLRCMFNSTLHLQQSPYRKQRINLFGIRVIYRSGTQANTHHCQDV